MLELHFLVMTSRERVSGPGAAVIVSSQGELGRGSVIKMVPVMGLITIIVSNTRLVQVLLPPRQRVLFTTLSWWGLS